MFQPLKLYSTIDAHIRSGATVIVPVNEELNVPMDGVGKFFVRLCYGEKGLTAPDSPFPPNFKGKPKKGIVLINNGPNEIVIPKGREIGEIYYLALTTNVIHLDVSELEVPESVKQVMQVMQRMQHIHTHKED